jgi:hypothetical protein
VAPFGEEVIGDGAYGVPLRGSGAAVGILRADQIDLDNPGRREIESENHWLKIPIVRLPNEKGSLNQETSRSRQGFAINLRQENR